jgi:hypothetical protein
MWPAGFGSASTISPIASACTKQTFVWDGGGAVPLAPATVDSGPSIPAEALAPSGNPAAGFQYAWPDSTAHMPQAKDNSGNLNSMVRTAPAGASHQWVDYIAATGIPHTSRPSCADLSDAGTGCSGAGGGTTVNINGSGVSNPNFNGTTPAAQTNNVNVTFQVSSSNVSAEIPVNSANAAAGLDANARIGLAQLPQDFTCTAASGSSTDYTCSFPTPPASLATGERYRFQADVANTAVSGKPAVAFNSFSAVKIVKVQGGVTTELGANDIRANQWVDLVYDGTNFQMISQLGNAPSGSMVYPGAGVPVSVSGTSWGTSLAVGGANGLVQLNASGYLPALNASLLTNFPTLNQSTSGTAANVTGIVAEANGGTGANNAAGAAGHVLRSNGTHYVDAALAASDTGLGSVTNDAQTKASVMPNTAPSAGQIPAGNAGNTAYAPVTVSGDATLSSTGALTLAAKYRVQPCEVHIWGSGTAGALQDTDDETNSCKNQTGATLTISGVSCWADAGSPTVTPVLTAGGAILTGAITCSQAEGGAAGTLNGTPTQADTKTINMNVTAAGGTAKAVVIYIKRTL